VVYYEYLVVEQEAGVTIETAGATITMTSIPSLTLKCAIDTDIQSVTAIVIARDGETIATVFEDQLPEARADQVNLKVSGTMTSSAGEMASLTLTWTEPTAAQNGRYRCKVKGYDAIGQGVVYYEYLVVEQEAGVTIDV